MPKPGRPKGTRKTGGGSRKGIPNKITGELKDMIVNALNNVGGEKYLERQAEAEPKSFMLLIGRVLPLQVKGDLSGKLTTSWEE